MPHFPPGPAGLQLRAHSIAAGQSGVLEECLLGVLSCQLPRRASNSKPGQKRRGMRGQWNNTRKNEGGSVCIWPDCKCHGARLGEQILHLLPVHA